MDTNYGSVSCSFRVKELPDFKIGIWYYKKRELAERYNFGIFDLYLHSKTEKQENTIT